MDYLFLFLVYFLIGVAINVVMIFKSVKDGSVTKLTIECLLWVVLLSLLWPAMLTDHLIKNKD